MYVDHVQYLDNTSEEMRDYHQVEHKPGWVIWRWSDMTIVIPSERIRKITTTEE